MQIKKNWSSNIYIRQNELKTEAIARDKEGHFVVVQLLSCV